MSNPEYQRVCKLAADRAKRITELEAKLEAYQKAIRLARLNVTASISDQIEAALEVGE
jgi:hypothetical protein